MRLISFFIGGTREKICAKNGSYRIYIRIRVSIFGRRTLRHPPRCVAWKICTQFMYVSPKKEILKFILVEVGYVPATHVLILFSVPCIVFRVEPSQKHTFFALFLVHVV